MTAVDVGCGTGEDAQGLAVTVAPDGRAIGVDVSTAMISEARRRAMRSAAPPSSRRAPPTLSPLVTHRSTCCDARESCNTCRLLRPASLRCMRVLRPGGRVALIDTDWRSLTLWPGDPAVTSGIRDAWVASCVNPAAGAQLGDLLGSTGFTEITMTADVLLFRSAEADDRPPVTLMAANAVRTGFCPRPSSTTG
jgi:SAM-dependent methyltransferase